MGELFSPGIRTVSNNGLFSCGACFNAFWFEFIPLGSSGPTAHPRRPTTSSYVFIPQPTSPRRCEQEYPVGLRVQRNASRPLPLGARWRGRQWVPAGCLHHRTGVRCGLPHSCNDSETRLSSPRTLLRRAPQSNARLQGIKLPPARYAGSHSVQAELPALDRRER